MCLITKNNKFILDKDIFVWKTFGRNADNKIVSYYYKDSEFIYKENIQYFTEIKTSDDISFFDNYASFHYENYKSTPYKRTLSYGPGFHSVLSIERLFADKLRYADINEFNDENNFGDENKIFYKCKIAKGSECVIDDSGLIVSSSIQLIEEIHIDECKKILIPLIDRLNGNYSFPFSTLLVSMLETSYSEIYNDLKFIQKFTMI